MSQRGPGLGRWLLASLIFAPASKISQKKTSMLPNHSHRILHFYLAFPPTSLCHLPLIRTYPKSFSTIKFLSFPRLLLSLCHANDGDWFPCCSKIWINSIVCLIWMGFVYFWVKRCLFMKNLTHLKKSGDVHSSTVSWRRYYLSIFNCDIRAKCIHFTNDMERHVQACFIPGDSERISKYELKQEIPMLLLDTK